MKVLHTAGTYLKFAPVQASAGRYGNFQLGIGMKKYPGIPVFHGIKISQLTQ